MGLETGNYVTDLVITNPTGADLKSTADDHLRLLKKVLKECLNGFAGAILLTATETGTASAHVLTPTTALVGYTANLMLLYRPANAGTGALTVNVSALGAKNVKTIAGADPTAGDIAANQPLLLVYDGTNFVILGGSAYLAKTGNQTMTGNLTLTGNGTISGTLDVTGDVTLGDDLTVVDDVAVGGDLAVTGTITGPSMTAKANVASPALTGVPTAPTAAVGTSTTQIATMQAIAQAVFAATIPVSPADAGYFLYTADGIAISWADIRRPGTVLAVASASASATIDFTGIGSTYNEYELHFQNVLPATSGSAFWLRVSKDGGSAFITSGYSYVDDSNDDTPTFGGSSGAAQAQIVINGGANVITGGTGTKGISGVIRIFAPSASRYLDLRFDTTHKYTSYPINTNGAGAADAGNTFTVNAVRLMFSAGNITSGTFQLVGLRKSV